MADSVKIRIDGDDRGFQKTLSGVVKGIGIAAATGMIALASAGVKYNAEMERYQTAFTTMLGSEERAIKLTQQLKEKAASTPFEMTDLASVTQLLMNYGQTAEQAIDKMSMLGDIAQGNAEKMNRIAMAYGQMSSLGRVTLEDIKQMIESGFNPLQQISQSTGESMDSLYARISKGTLSVDEITAAMVAATSAGGKYFGSMDRQSKTFDGLMSTLKDTTLSTIGKMSGGLSDFARNEALPMLIKIAGDVGDAFGTGGFAGVLKLVRDELPTVTALVSGLGAALSAYAILAGINRLMAAFATAQVSLALASMQSNLATMALNGSLTASEVIVGLLTGKITLATAAQALFNKVMAANPVLLLAAAIGALVGGVVLLQGHLRKTHPEMYALSDATKEAAKQTKDLNAEAEKTAKTFAESNAEIEKQSVKSNALVDSLVELSGAYSGSRLEQERMDSIIAKLNSSVPGLTIEYNKQTGALNMNEAAIRDVIKAQLDNSRASAAIARATQLVEEQADAEYALWVARKAYDDVVASGADKNSSVMRFAAKAVRDAENAYSDAGVAVDEYNTFLDESGIATNEAATAVDDLGASLEEVPEKIEPIIIAGRDMTDVLEATGMTADDASARLDGYTSAATSLFDKINEKSDTTVKQMIENLESNVPAMERFGDNVAYLGGKLPAALLDPMKDSPKEFAGAIAELAGASDEELARISELFNEGGQAAVDAWLQSLGAQDDSGMVNLASAAADAVNADTTLDAAVAQAVTDAKTIMISTVETSSFDEVGDAMIEAVSASVSKAYETFVLAGQYMIKGFIAGMKSKRQEMINAAVALAKASVKAFNDALLVKSPSRLTMKSGVNFVDGFIVKIREGVARTQTAVANLASAAVGGFNNNLTSRSFETYGGGARQSAAAGGIVQNIEFNVPVVSPISVMNRLQSEQAVGIYG